MAPRSRHRRKDVTANGVTKEKLSNEGAVNVLISADDEWWKRIAKAPEFGRPHPNVLREELYWCPVAPIGSDGCLGDNARVLIPAQPSADLLSIPRSRHPKTLATAKHAGANAPANPRESTGARG